MNNPHILVTRELDELSLQLAQKPGLHVVVEPMIRIEFLTETSGATAEIEARNFDAIAFTSPNAVKAFSDILWKEKIKVPQVKFFAIGDTTARHLKLLDVEVQVPQKNDAVQLAELILKNKCKKILFPCAEHHLEDLPQWLRMQHVDVQELIVYRTILLKKKVDLQHVQGVVFMSPSAVKSFFSANKLPEAVPVFVIGKTTAAELQKKFTGEIIISDKPDIGSIFEKVQAHFTQSRVK